MGYNSSANAQGTQSPTPNQLKKYANDFDDKSFWKKIVKIVRSAGKKVVYLALLLYYTSTASSTPYDKKLAIWGALAYLILPMDLIPDFLPGGYVDDMGAMYAVYETVRGCITPAIEQQAKRKLEDWFPGPVPQL